MTLKIEEMYAFVSEDKEGNEGIIAGTMPNGMMMPLVGADMARIQSLKPYAKEVADRSQTKVKILHFSGRKQIGEIIPEPSSRSG